MFYSEEHCHTHSRPSPSPMAVKEVPRVTERGMLTLYRNATHACMQNLAVSSAPKPNAHHTTAHGNALPPLHSITAYPAASSDSAFSASASCIYVSSSSASAAFLRKSEDTSYSRGSPFPCACAAAAGIAGCVSDSDRPVVALEVRDLGSGIACSVFAV